MVAILLIGLTASAVLYSRTVRGANDEQAALAQRASRVLQNSTSVLEAALGGASVMVGRDGSVDPAAFAAFARGVVETT
ncbi:MAG TPA: hypothetical protein PLV68_07385, partial [Ilumatobacteraceae bacterium]|nr:hypothetical protein [Ilumatobacteraceae bacterium]